MGLISDKYFATYIDGTLTVSDKVQNEIVFDQNLSNLSATVDYLDLLGYSKKLNGELTNLPIVYAIDDESVARVLVTREDALVSYWKLDEKLYSAARDTQVGIITLMNLPVVVPLSLDNCKIWKRNSSWTH